MRSRSAPESTGVLVDLPLQVGQHVSARNDAGQGGAAESSDGGPERWPRPRRGMCRLGEPASVDTHNGVITGTVMRVDPSSTKRNGDRRRQTDQANCPRERGPI